MAIVTRFPHKNILRIEVVILFYIPLMPHDQLVVQVSMKKIENS